MDTVSNDETMMKHNKALMVLRMTYKDVKETKDSELFLCSNDGEYRSLVDIHGKILLDANSHLGLSVDVMSDYGKTLVHAICHIGNENICYLYLYKKHKLEQLYESLATAFYVRQMKNMIEIRVRDNMIHIMDYSGNIKLSGYYINVVEHYPTNDIVCTNPLNVNGNTSPIETFDIIDCNGNVMCKRALFTDDMRKRYMMPGHLFYQRNLEWIKAEVKDGKIRLRSNTYITRSYRNDFE